MIRALDPRRIEITRHIMDARRLAKELNDEMLDYLLELALNENLGHDAAARAAVLERFPDPES
ncbi:hypothetical protein [Aliihoeflea sp. 40Bstr573]|uniref:hypothetical protein n=1 Tax=Aliihoeflea sp. 40Bstr573 TaxID=2696467 RepID=UPI002094CF24|nr:hypothetical protein [Aliihoeflea sp. 40Bstr573]MCO6386336.1 hypothetical protein [Aliihoeflea sp. 40Bstr573]